MGWAEMMFRPPQQKGFGSASTFRVSPTTRASETQDGVLLLDLRRGRYFSLAGSAAHIWAGLAAGLSYEAVVESLNRRYSRPPQQLAAELDRFISQLLAARLVTVEQ